ncbi:MAG: PAS domain S-box protein, partial [Dehalococcoidia bacterium]
MPKRDRRRTKDAFRGTEELYRKIVTNSNDAIFVIDPSRDAILDVNPRACSMLGYTREELLSTPVSSVHPKEMPQLMAFAETVLKDGQGWTNELTCLTKSGQVLPAEISASSIDVDGRPCMVALIRDITERKQAGEALRESEERYRKVFHYSSDAIFIVDNEKDQILDANPKACSILGYSREELLKIPMSTIHQHEMPKLEAFARLVSESREGWSDELSCMTKSGRTLPCEISASIVDIGGRACTISILHDLTERREIEESSRELAVLGERNRLAREIHDSLAQGLTGIIWQLNVLEKSLGSEEKAALDLLERTRNLVKDSLQEARRSVWDLRSGALQGLPLAEAVRRETERITEGQ